ncbi:MAG: hypothetical protein BHV77_15345 [Bacteroides sp. 43_108]|nr:MAG: hypothetical protein BHV77_15345 [Bacteroides sp. 43_108]
MKKNRRNETPQERSPKVKVIIGTRPHFLIRYGTVIVIAVFSIFVYLIMNALSLNIETIMDCVFHLNGH